MPHLRRELFEGGLCVLVAYLLAGAMMAQVLEGKPGSSPQWGSGWLDLDPPVNFAKGDQLKLTVGGTASKILVRLLPDGGDRDTPDGVVGGPVIVPSSRTVNITLPGERKKVVEISVHGGPKPWDKYDLGAHNGPATLKSVERMKAK
jgi:hypothetical protein